MAKNLIVSFHSSLLDAFIQSFHEHQDNIGILIGRIEDSNIIIDNFASYVDDESLLKMTKNSVNDGLIVGYYLKGDISKEIEFKILKKLDQISHIRSKQYDLPLKLEFSVKDNKINLYNCVIKDGKIFKFNQMRSVHEGEGQIEYENFDEDCFFFLVFNRDNKLNKLYENPSIGSEVEGPTPFQLQQLEYLNNVARFSHGNEFFFDPSIHEYSESKDYVHILEKYCNQNHFQCVYNFIVDFENGVFQGFMRFMPMGLVCGGYAKSSYQAKQLSAQKLLHGLRSDVYFYQNPNGKNIWTWEGPVQKKNLKTGTQNEAILTSNGNKKLI